MNKDVTLLQSQLKEALPTRTDIINLRSAVVKEQETKGICTTSTKTFKGTDHCVSSQKSVIEEDYGIRFPVKCARNESSKQVVLAGQEKDDFQLLNYNKKK